MISQSKGSGCPIYLLSDLIDDRILTYPDNTFDLSINRDGDHHDPRRRESISPLYRTSKPGTTCYNYLPVPNPIYRYCNPSFQSATPLSLLLHQGEMDYLSTELGKFGFEDWGAEFRQEIMILPGVEGISEEYWFWVRCMKTWWHLRKSDRQYFGRKNCERNVRRKTVWPSKLSNIGWGIKEL